MSQAEYARHLGISREAVRQRTVTAGGPIPVHGPKKLIDVAEADALWESTKTPQGEGGAGACRVAAVRPDGTPVEVDASRYQRAKAMRMEALAEREQLELRVRRRELVDRQRAERQAEEAGQRERAAWTAWSVRTAAGLADVLDVDGDRIADLLGQAVRAQLEALAATARAQADGC